MDSGVRLGTGTLYKFCFAIAAVISFGSFVAGQELQQARVTQLYKDVKLLPGQAAPRPAALNDEVKQGVGVRTGIDSRTELTFNDLTITRLAANTVFSFDREKRELKLTNGATLIQIPPGAPEVKVTTAAVSAAITGGTALFDAPTGKLLVMEGLGRIWRTGHPDEVLMVHAGEMVWLLARGQITKPRTFDVKRVLETSRLITDFAPLPNLDLILQTIETQLGFLLIPDRNIVDTISYRTALTEPTPPPEVAPTPPPVPSDFGPPQTIAFPTPYDIGSSTLIITDPTITNAGVTDYGTIYRNQTQDGPIATWAFGSTSPFDVASGFDANLNPLLQNVAVFKFVKLNLNAQPTIVTNGGPNRLGLIGIDGINSTGEGGTFTFAGLDFVFLATQNGAINLGSQITFDGVNRLLLYARGPNGSMTLSSDFNNIGRLSLIAENGIQMNSAAISHNGGDISLLSGGTINLQSGSKLFSLQNSEAGAGGTVNVVSRGGDITTSGEIEADGGTIIISNAIGSAQSAVLQLSSASPTIVLGGSLTADTINVSSGGDLIIAGGISVAPGENFSLSAAGDIKRPAGADVDGILLGVGMSGHTIDSSASVTMLAGGNVMTSGTVGLFLHAENGGAIGSDATISLTAANVSANSLIEVLDLTNGRVGGAASITQNVLGDVNVVGNAEYRILNFGNGTTGIGGNAGIAVSANNISANLIVADIDSDGGPIGGDATITFNVSGTVNTTSDVNTHVELPESGGNSGHNAITFNGGTYNVGGSFISFISGADGIITLNNANVHADAVRVSAFGDNGVLKIGGGSINANTLLRLYAPGSNGVIDFVANVTLNSHGVAAIINANTVTIENNVVVTITGAGGTALVYTNHPNYSGFGGNGSTSGTFAGNGAVTNPASTPPPFSQATASAKSAVAPSTNSDSTSTIGRRRNGRTKSHRTKLTSFAKNSPGSARHAYPGRQAYRIGVRVRNSDQLLDLVTEGVADPDVLRHHAQAKSKERRGGGDDRRDRSRPSSQNVRLSDRTNENGRSPRL